MASTCYSTGSPTVPVLIPRPRLPRSALLYPCPGCISIVREHCCLSCSLIILLLLLLSSTITARMRVAMPHVALCLAREPTCVKQLVPGRAEGYSSTTIPGRLDKTGAGCRSSAPQGQKSFQTPYSVQNQRDDKTQEQARDQDVAVQQRVCCTSETTAANSDNNQGGKTAASSCAK